MKKIIISIIVISILLTFKFTNASNGQPFQELWDAIFDLQQQITDIELTPGPQGEIGPTGPQGPVGPQGPEGAPWGGDSYFRILGSAGNSVYVAVGDNVYAADLNQSFWEQSFSLPPVPVSNIVFYNYVTAITDTGEGWRNRNYNSWESIGYIPTTTVVASLKNLEK